MIRVHLAIPIRSSLSLAFLVRYNYLTDNQSNIPSFLVIFCTNRSILNLLSSFNVEWKLSLSLSLSLSIDLAHRHNFHTIYLTYTLTHSHTQCQKSLSISHQQELNCFLCSLSHHQIERFIGLWGNFSKPLATINLPKSATFLGNFCKGVQIFNFSSEIIFGQLL